MGEKEKKVIKTISEDQKLGQLMNENKTDKNVSRKTIFKKLRKKD
jgi:hypothetical protein